MARKKTTAKAPLEEKSTENNQSSQENNSENQFREQQPSTAVTTPQAAREPVKVNLYNLKELKNACDDCLTKV
jgi:hypothetical protein